MFFHKNKRKSAFCTKRTVFCALFSFTILGIMGISPLINTRAAETPIKTVEIFSEHESFEDNNPGAWKVTKSAEWIDNGKARITFQINSRIKRKAARYSDILLVIDNSGSMNGQKLSQVKSDAFELVNSVLADQNNRIALVTFETNSEILSDFTNDKDALLELIENIYAIGGTNYNQGLTKALEILDGYERQNNRELILLFLTDGYPNVETPNEIAQYNTIKALYPYITINGIQYEMGTEILQPIVEVTDNQFIANMDSLNNVLFNATVISHLYSNFTITDYIDSSYWDIDDINSISPSIGTVSLDNNGSTPVITWSMNDIYRSGQTATLTIDINLKDEISNQIYDSSLLLPTNTHEIIESSITSSEDEYIDSDKTPILNYLHSVTYDANLPSGCEVHGVVPDLTYHAVYSSVEISSSSLACPGYNFKGWVISTDAVARINSDYFRMPDQDVILKAIWAKPDLSKTMDGTTHTRASSLFDKGENVNAKIKQLCGRSPSAFTDCWTITSIERADQLSTLVDINDDKYILSSADSSVPIYGWIDGETFYYYSDAENVYLNQNSSYMFNRLSQLKQVPGLSSVITSNATNMSSMFYEDLNLRNIDSLASWDVSNVTTMSYMFSDTALTNVDSLINWNTASLADASSFLSKTDNLESIEGLKYWNTSNLIYAANMFQEARMLSNINAFTNWDTSNLVNISHFLHEANSVESLEPFRNWRTSNLTTMDYAFANTDITNLDPLAGWNTSNVTNLTGTFAYSYQLTDITGIQNWDTSKVQSMSYLFVDGVGITDISALGGWNTSNVYTMSHMFENANQLPSIAPISNWNTSNVMDMSYMFSRASSLATLGTTNTWDTSNVGNMTYMFYSNSQLSDISALRNWNVSKVTNMARLFYGDYYISDISSLSNWRTTSLTNMENMFRSVQMENIDALTNWDTSKVTNMYGTFYLDSNLTNIDGARNWDTSKVTTMDYMFYNTPKLTNIDGATNWNTSSLTNASYIFCYASKLENVNGARNWDMSKVTNLTNAFNGTNSLSNIDPLENWNTQNVTNMSHLFHNSQGITNVNGARNWNTSKVTNMTSMFEVYAGTSNLTDISGLSNWDTSRVTSMSRMFYNNIAIESLAPIYGWNTSNVTSMTDMFYRVPTAVTRPTWYH